MHTPGSWSRLWFRSAAGICGSLVVLTLVYVLLNESSDAVGLLRWFRLTGENNVASWWSGVLLLLVGLHALDGFFLWRREEPDAARGWLALALLTFLFSADEIGSLHERICSFSPLGAWQSLIPFAFLVVALMGATIRFLLSSRLERRKVFSIASAFLLFGTVAFQEVLEHTITWPEPWGALRSVAEESTELVAGLILLAAAMANTRGRFGPGGASPVLEGVCSHRTWFFLGGFGLAPLLAFASASFPDQQRGHPADWYAAVVFVVAGLAAVQPFLRGYAMNSRRWGLAATCVAASAGSVALEPMFDDASIDALDVSRGAANPRLVFLLLVSLALTAQWAWISRSEWRSWAPIASVLLVVSFASLFSPALVTVYSTTQIVALLAYRAQSAEPRTVPDSARPEIAARAERARARQGDPIISIP